MGDPASNASSYPAALGERLGFLLIRANAGASRLATESLRPLGIDPRDYGVLALIDELGPLSQQALSELLNVDRSTMVSLVDQLEERALVRRRRNAADRRAYAIEATPAGVQTQKQAAALLRECEARFLRPLSAAEQRTFLALLSRLVDESR